MSNVYTFYAKNACKICKIVYNIAKEGDKLNIEELEKKLKYEFKNKNLIKIALTHTSYAYENKVKSNEKLEFLGDSILEFISSKYIYENYPKLREGEMTKVRAQVVCGKTLAKIAKKLGFSDFLLLGKSEKLSGRKAKDAMLEDSMEAMIAAIYLDSGIEEAEQFIIRNLTPEISYATEHVGIKDYKTVLQEKLQEHGDVEIKYEIVKEIGPDHDKSFKAQVEFNGKILATGVGKSKKEAEMQAAKKALEFLK